MPYFDGFRWKGFQFVSSVQETEGLRGGVFHEIESPAIGAYPYSSPLVGAYVVDRIVA